MKATILDLRRRMNDVLKALNRNEPVTIFYRGRKKAVLLPADHEGGNGESCRSSEAFGIWSDHTGTDDVETYVRGIRRGRFDGL